MIHHAAASRQRPPRCFLRGLAALLVVGGMVRVGLSAEAAEQATDRIPDSSWFEHTIGHVTLKGSARFGGDVERLQGGAQLRQLFQSPIFVSGGARWDQERRQPYDLRHIGGDLGMGWALNEHTDVLATYRLDHYKVFNVGSNSDPAFRTVKGRSRVTALGLNLLHDTRDDHAYPTEGLRVRTGGDVALEGLGGDYNFGRLQTDVAWYATPFRHHPTATWLDDVTFVEHLLVGWMNSFGDTDRVPFFERYFVGGTTTVRGHRPRWLTPRGLEEQFVGGEIELVNNVEARVPIFPTLLNRQLSAAAFFDVGRAYHRFSEIGDFGYGVGGGLRYVLKVWTLSAVLRLDYGFSLGHEGDDAIGRLHASLGVPF